MAFRLNGTKVASGGPKDRLLSWERVQDMTGISRTTAWRLQQHGAFPTPVPLSPGRVGWWESELTAWKASRLDARPLVPPARPRLPGMARLPAPRPTLPPPPTPRPLPKPRPAPRPEPAASGPPVPAQAAPVRSAVTTRSRRRAVHPDQIDFGF